MCYHPYLSNMLDEAGLNSLDEAGLKLDKEQYYRLILCIKKDEIADWNNWRSSNPDVDIWLSGADFRGYDLTKADLRNAHLEFSNFYKANLTSVSFYGTKLTNAYLSGSKLNGVEFQQTDLKRLRARGAEVDDLTFIWHCDIDNETDFAGVVLDKIRINPKLKQALEENVRHIDEHKWYGNSYILHLSDLHFGSMADAKLWSDQIASDISYEMKCPYISAIIIAGDLTNTASEEEYLAAYHFISRLRQEFHLQRYQIAIVPGNHDLNWTLSKQAYQLIDRKEYTGTLKDGFYIKESEDVIRLQDESKYKERFKLFKIFYHGLTGMDYPIEYEDQGILYHLLKQNILILGLNSSWQIDHHYTSRASIHSIALSNALSQIRKDHSLYENCLKIAVWHHPINSSSEDRIRDHGFMERLAQAEFHVCLHGHIHKANNSLYRYDQTINGRRLNIISAGTFGAPTKQWVPGFPLQYNLLKWVENKLIVETRKREEINGAWKPDARWTTGAGSDPLPRYEIALPKLKQNGGDLSEKLQVQVHNNEQEEFFSKEEREILEVTNKDFGEVRIVAVQNFREDLLDLKIGDYDENNSESRIKYYRAFLSLVDRDYLKQISSNTYRLTTKARKVLESA